MFVMDKCLQTNILNILLFYTVPYVEYDKYRLVNLPVSTELWSISFKYIFYIQYNHVYFIGMLYNIRTIFESLLVSLPQFQLLW